MDGQWMRLGVQIRYGKFHPFGVVGLHRDNNIFSSANSCDLMLDLSRFKVQVKRPFHKFTA
jgi:hypothetical protein